MRRIALLAVLTVACGHRLSEADRELAKALREENAGIQAELDVAAQQSAHLNGGLIKSLITVREEILRTNLALIEQRIHAVETGAPVTVETRATRVDVDRAAALALEIREQEAKVAVAESKGGGGLVGALTAATAAMERFSLAMLRQQYLVAKYGLADIKASGALPVAVPTAAAATEPAPWSPPPPPAPAPSVVQPAPAPAPPPPPAQLVDAVEYHASSRITESNSTWSRFAWRLSLRNLTRQTLKLDATIEFQDADGYVIDSAYEYDILLPADGQEHVVTGSELIKAEGAPRVAKVVSKVEPG